MWYLILFEVMPWSGLIALSELSHFSDYKKCQAAQREVVAEIRNMKVPKPPVPICINIEKINEKDW